MKVYFNLYNEGFFHRTPVEAIQKRWRHHDAELIEVELNGSVVTSARRVPKLEIIDTLDRALREAEGKLARSQNLIAKGPTDA